jgi:hypothetical protein
MAMRIDGTNTTANPGITGTDADTGLQFGTDEIQLVTGGTNRATVESNGNFTIEDGNLVVAAGHGIDFSATADGSGTMTSELLDDYEEGTWTPFLSATNFAGSVTYQSNNGGYYVKIGKAVFVYGLMAWSARTLTAGTNFSIAGLPFLTNSDQKARSGINLNYTSSPWTGITIYQIAVRTESAATHCSINYSNTTNGSMVFTPSYNHIDNNGSLIFSGQYLTD